jgi:putative ABC transport system permease protein
MSPLAVAATALAAVSANKLRSLLTLLGIVIGVAAVISLMAIGRGTQARITANIEALGTNLLFVQPGATRQQGIAGALGSAATLTLDDAFALVDPLFAPSVATVAPELRTTGRIVANRKNVQTQMVGVTPEYESVRNFPVRYGRFISAADAAGSSAVVVLGSRVSETLFGARDPVGQPVRINGRQFEVVGVLKSKGGGAQAFTDNQALVPITTAYYRLSSQRTAQGGVSVQSINVQVRNNDQMDAAVTEISTLLRLRHRITDEDDFTVTSQQETIDTLRRTTETFVVFLGAIAGISLLVGGIGIMNIMLVSVTERTREIGIRKAMGAKRRDVLAQFLTEASLLSLIGGAVGVGVGAALTILLNGRSLGNQTFTTAFSNDVALLAIAVSVGIGLFFGIYPAARAARLHPIQALRYE